MPARAEQRKVKVTMWVRPNVKEAYQEQAKREGLNLSQTAAAALEESLARHLHVSHAGILEPIIEQGIAKEMRGYSSRIAMLLVRAMFASEQSRALAVNILARQPGVTQPVLEHILDGTSDTARRNIKQVTPQLATLIAEVEKWLTPAA